MWKGRWCYLKDQQQIEATAMPRLEGQREEVVSPEPRGRVICGGWDVGEPVPWALEPWEASPTDYLRQKEGGGDNLASPFLSASKTPASAFR